MKYQKGFPHLSRTKCKDCGIVFANPVANTDELMEFYSNYYNKGNFGALDYKKRIKEKISQTKTKSIVNIRLEKKRILASQPIGHFLDIGFGLGEQLAEFDRLGFTIYGTEYDADCIDFVKQEIPHASLFKGDLLQAGYKNQQFNIIHLYHVIEHLIDPIAYIKELNRIVSPGGIVIVGTPNSGSWAYQLYRIINFICFKIPSIVDGLEHTIVFNKKNLKQVFTSNGFTVIQQYSESVSDGFSTIFKSNLSLRKKIVRYVQTFLPINQVLIAKKTMH